MVSVSRFTGLPQQHRIAISMDGKGAWRDNVIVERFWRSLKYEEVYLRAYESVPEAKDFIGRYIEFYNGRRPHSGGAAAVGIKNLLCITGDPPKMGNYPDATAVFDVDAIGLVNIVHNLNRGLDIGGNPIEFSRCTNLGRSRCQ